MRASDRSTKASTFVIDVKVMVTVEEMPMPENEERASDEPAGFFDLFDHEIREALVPETALINALLEERNMPFRVVEIVLTS